MMELRTKEFETQWKADGQGGVPSHTDLALINRFAIEPLAAEQVYSRTMRLCNDQYDRSFERFPLGYLARFRDTLPGKSVLVSHDKAAPPVGRFFKCDVVSEGGANHLMASFYAVRTDGNAELRSQIDGGVMNHVSIGFRWADLTCDLCGQSYYRSWVDPQTNERRWCPHIMGRDYNGRTATGTWSGDLGRVEGVEGSLVYLGSQYDSNVVKSAIWTPDGERAPLDPHEASKGYWRSYFVRNDGEERALSETQTGAKGAESAAAGASDAEAKGVALADTAASEARIRELEAALVEVETLVADGRLYRVDLAAEVKRLAGIVAAAKEAEMVLKVCEDCTQLKAVRDEYAARAEKLFPPRPQAKGTVDGGAPGAAQRAGQGARSHTVL